MLHINRKKIYSRCCQLSLYKVDTCQIGKTNPENERSSVDETKQNASILII